MKPRKSDITKKVREWLTYAEEDLRIARHALTLSSSVPYRLIAFHAQQCVEKYLKSYLVYHNIDFPYTHDIGKLLKWCEEKADWTGKIRQAEELTPFAVTARYPGIGKSITKRQALRAVKIASQARNVIRRALIKEGLKIENEHSK